MGDGGRSRGAGGASARVDGAFTGTFLTVAAAALGSGETDMAAKDTSMCNSIGAASASGASGEAGGSSMFT